jgi:hypothetical protein
VTRRLTTDEIIAVLDNLTEDDMDRARASLARDAARRDAAVTETGDAQPQDAPAPEDRPFGDREQRRDTIGLLLALDTLDPAGVQALRGAVAAEMRDADRAIERADLRDVQIETCRTGMSTALRLGTSAPWSELPVRAREVQEVARAARQGEAEAIRARTTAEQRAREANAGTAEAVRCRDMYEQGKIDADERARQAREESGKWLRQLRDTERQLGNARRHIERASRVKLLANTAATDALTRAERPEQSADATVTVTMPASAHADGLAEALANADRLYAQHLAEIRSRVAALHSPFTALDQVWCDECSTQRSTGPRTSERVALIPHPCRTIQALDGEES